MKIPLIVATLILLPLLAVRGERLAVEAWTAAGRAARTTPEQRRLDSYGDCAALGYGYLQRVTTGIPDPAIRPVVRYKHYNLHGDRVLVDRASRTDPRILVGIELGNADLEAQVIEARPLLVDGLMQAWTFETVDDFDLLQGVRIAFAAASPSTRQLRIQLFGDPNRKTALGAWTIDTAAGSTTADLMLSPPVEKFSIDRGGMPFLLEITGAPIASAQLLARTADLRNFSIVHRSGGCFTAVRGDLLDEAARDRAWAAWIESLRQLP